MTWKFIPLKYASFSRHRPLRDGVTIAKICVALVVELVDTRDLKSLGVRAVPVQVRPGAPSKRCMDFKFSFKASFSWQWENNQVRRVGRVAMQRIANPWTSVRLRDAPPLFWKPVSYDWLFSFLVLANRFFSSFCFIRIRITKLIWSSFNILHMLIIDFINVNQLNNCMGRLVLISLRL